MKEETKPKKYICWARGCNKELDDEYSLLCKKHDKEKRPINLKVPSITKFDNTPGKF